MALSIDLLEFLNTNCYEQHMFRNAIYNSDKKLVNKLIKTYSSLKDQILHVAAHLGNIKILKEFILAGADINKTGAVEDNCFTPLQRAVSENQFHAVKLLVQAGANVNACYEGRCHGNCSTLNIAINNHPENLEMINFLLSSGADSNQSCDRCYTPLIKAIKDHQQEIVQVLLKFNADVNLPCNYFGDKVTPLYMAAKQNQLETIKLLLSKNANVHALTANRNQSVLHGAIPSANQEVVKFLLTAGVDPNIVDSSDKTVVDLGSHMNYRFTSTIKEHLVKLKAAGLHLSERNLEVINSQEFNKVLDSCLIEVELMKKCRIAHTRVFFYDLLHATSQSVALKFKCVKEENILNYYEKFPLYSDLIDYRLKQVLIRQDRLRNVNLFFEDVFWSLLPDTFVRNISCYLDENFIEQFIKNL